MTQTTTCAVRVAFARTEGLDAVWLLADTGGQAMSLTHKDVDDLFADINAAIRDLKRGHASNPEPTVVTGQAYDDKGTALVRVITLGVTRNASGKAVHALGAQDTARSILSGTGHLHHWRRVDTLEPVFPEPTVFNDTRHAFAQVRRHVQKHHNTVKGKPHHKGKNTHAFTPFTVALVAQLSVDVT